MKNEKDKVKFYTIAIFISSTKFKNEFIIYRIVREIFTKMERQLIFIKRESNSNSTNEF